MVCVTRFNPSCNGALHLGHAYTLLVNERFAHERGGQFYVRFDDMPYKDMHRESDPARIARIRDGMRRDIEWLGAEVDGWYSEAEMKPQVEEVWRQHGFTPPPYDSQTVHSIYVHQPTNWLSYPYQPVISADRAVLEGIMGTTHMIRGEELATDLSLHCWFCERFGYPVPLFYFLPRLQGVRGDISKTSGGYTLAGLRNDGYTPGEVRRLLTEGSLVNPYNGWGLENLKPQPRVAL